jgi:hypothetical protein
MGVNGGAGNAISLSELQTYYGGSNPISLSEYYRNGSLVPGDQVTSQSNVSGTADQTVGQFTVDVTTTNAFTGSITATTINPFNNNASYTIAADTAYVIYGHAHPDADGGSSTISGTITIGGSSSSYSTEDNTGNGAFVVGGYLRGPANNGAINTGQVLSAGTGVTASTSGGNYSRLIKYTRANVTTHDVDFRNNNAVTITTTSGSTGGAQTYTQNQTRKVKNDQSTSNWTLGYNAVNGNTNVPSSGTINMNVFNAPGNPTP